MERLLDCQVWFLYFFWYFCCLQYITQIVDGRICCKKLLNIFPGFSQPGVRCVAQSYLAHVSVKYILNVGWLWYHHYNPSSQLHTIVSEKRNSNVLGDLFPRCSHIVSRVQSPYVNIELPRDLDISDFDFSFLEVACCKIPACMPLPIPELLPLPEPLPLPYPPLPLPMAVDCRQSYWPCFLIGQKSLNLWCWWYQFLGLGTLITLWIFGGCLLVSLCL